MKSTWIIAERELFNFFNSTLAYGMLVAWLLFHGLVFTISFGLAAEGQLGPNENPVTFVLGGWIFFHIANIAFVPALTMRSVAEEYRSGNIESILSTTVSELAFTMGKFLGCVLMWVALWVPTLIYVWLTSRYGSLDMGVIGSCYLGVLAMGSALIAIGILASTIAKTQLTAFLLAFVIIAGIFMIGIFTFSLPEGPGKEIANYLSFWEQSTTFARGIIDSRYLALDASLVVFSLFVSHRILVARRLA